MHGHTHGHMHGHMNEKPTEYAANVAWKSNITSFLNFVSCPLSRT